jgi:hypothetical protein
MEITIHQDRRLDRVPVMRVVWRGLEVPGQFAGIRMDGNNRTGKKIVPLANAAGQDGMRVPRP